MAREYTVITRVHTNTGGLIGGTYRFTKGEIEKWTYIAENNPLTQLSNTIIENLAYAGNGVDWHTHEVIAVIETDENNVHTDFDRDYPVEEEAP